MAALTPATEPLIARIALLTGTPLLATSHADPLRASGEPVRWGVVSTGRIASMVVSDLALLPDAVLQAVSSRTQGGADNFATRHGFCRAYGDAGGVPGYMRLLQDQKVDVVYVATPHASHYTVAKAALEAGKHVLCEKPMTINAREASSLVSLAQEKGLFLMEAVWSRFLPSVQRAAQITASGELGEIRWMQADLGFPAPYHPDARLWKREDGGGALMDVGVYLLTWALAVLGRPHSLTATSHRNRDGVDAETAMTLLYPSGAQAQLMTSLTTVSTQTATVSGTKGMLRCNAPLFNPTELTITTGSGESRVEKFTPAGRGYTYQLREVLRCVQQGLTESATMPLAESLITMTLLDEARRQTGIRYPAD
ncbi:Gfo/Idh/MocA family protein [Arthrobacter globiformis]|uniref:Gfo/Idh/MocA family protein n=1 Tax=Arthrobacter globiformis TaxID=1665 RepID=UPI00278F1E9D|nr:Gfo/Idh/MocA family oxidoreductase [Arthrobacter globiformis]MDQ0618599.1 putative dehydrogenase [Arthrobacter globiformis]